MVVGARLVRFNRIEKARARVYLATSTRSKVPVVKAAHVLLSLVCLTVLSACLNTTESGPPNSQIRVVNATGQTVNLFLDNQLAIENSNQLNVSLIVTPPGTHTLGFRTANGVETPVSFTTTPGGFSTVYGYTNGSGAIVAVAMDTTAVPPSGQAAVRVINVSHLLGDVDIYGSQPNGTPGTQFVTPFNYLTTSPFMLKSQGSWEVYTTAVGSSTRLRSTGAFPIEDGGRRTVFLIDSGTVPVFRILPN
jgi:hypothetical protein